MFHLILFEPEIPPNTGNIMRLCANSGVFLHLVKPLGFSLEEKMLRRAGLDYRDFADVSVHDSLDECLENLQAARVFALTTRATRPHSEPAFKAGDAFLMGPETRGLPAAVLEMLPDDQRLRIPMRAGSRSMNLSNAAAVIVYEAWRQLDYEGSA